MTETINSRLEKLGVVLPQAAAPAANYLPYMISGDLVFTAGQLPLKDGAYLVKAEDAVGTQSTGFAFIVVKQASVHAFSLTNTLIAGNLAAESPDCFGDFASNGYNLVQDPTGCNGTKIVSACGGCPR